MQSAAPEPAINRTNRLLIVEDERIVAQDLKNTLSDLGYMVIGIMSSAEQAIEGAAEHKPDLILMDIRLPGAMDGIEAARRIAKTLGTPVVFLTAHSDGDTLRRAKESDPFGYVVKPFNQAELHCAIEIALHRYQRQIQLETISKERQAFSHSVARDLRGPLLSIDGLSQALLEDHAHDLTDEALDYLQRVRNASHRMREMIEDLLRLGKITAGDLVLNAVDLSALARSVGKAYQDEHPLRNVVYQVQDGVRVQCDANLMRLALDNLLGNAWKFSTGKNPAVVEFGAFLMDGRQVVFVRDNGVGFNMAHAARLFEPFHRLHSQAEFEGTGLGLTIVKQVVDRHNGQLWVHAQPREGATFYFCLDSVKS